MNDPKDERHKGDHFIAAPAIFPNNDIKFEVHKIRAQLFAAENKRAITWSIAKDKPSNKIISEKMNPEAEKWFG